MKALKWNTVNLPENRKKVNLKKASYGKSLTIPNQAMSLKTLLYNYTRGIDPPSIRHGEYLGDELIPDFSTMDISEIAEYKQNLANTINDLQGVIKESEKAEAEQRKERYKKAQNPQNLTNPQTTENQQVIEKPE